MKAKTFTVTDDLIVRFFSHVEQAAGEACWIWTGGMRRQMGPSYGYIVIGRTQFAAHRVAWNIAYGEWPTLFVLHSCDNRKCVRIDHLRVGTHKENMADMVMRGRSSKMGGPVRRGEEHPNSRLTNSLVREIRDLRSTGLGPTAIAQEIGATRAMVRSVLTRETWGHVT